MKQGTGIALILASVTALWLYNTGRLSAVAQAFKSGSLPNSGGGGAQVANPLGPGYTLKRTTPGLPGLPGTQTYCPKGIAEGDPLCVEIPLDRITSALTGGNVDHAQAIANLNKCYAGIASGNPASCASEIQTLFTRPGDIINSAEDVVNNSIGKIFGFRL